MSRLSQQHRHNGQSQRNRKLRSTPLKRSNSRRRLAKEHYKKGYAAGYQMGIASGKEQFDHHIEGTSIIIPTYNKLNLLKQCIASIQQYTSEAHEIIVVDDASTDGTAAYLRKLSGQIRYHIHDKNYGFASSMNTGLKMAKGKTICLLNNDIIVTTNWLGNLLHCLESDPAIGMVGPVTNYISGEQQIEVSYSTNQEMQQFARQHNEQDASKWKIVERIVGFCMLFQKSFFEQTGYLDEGYKIGNFEDEDFIIRTRLAGRKLAIAGDCFIHHFGSQSMRELGEQLQEIYKQNEAFYQQKWSNPYEWVQRVTEWSESQAVIKEGEWDTGASRRAISFYPTHVAVTGLNGTVFWVEQGVKYPIQGAYPFPAVKLSQIELLSWPTGSDIEADIAAEKWRGTMTLDDMIPDGGVFVTESGHWFQRDGNTCRMLISEYVLKRWKLSDRVMSRSGMEKSQLVEGLPIMAAPVLVNGNL
ncbi:glycosyltransferase family 2 protein [Paenibacillus arenosi]|uniref:Glycosyltransferase family 2 protein n=1 Tax=Paenibacillus arenosi TaxID=2774142 RepID=A0ABR9B448_9BACL|nr:glycosyltransferase family 2 protein [Paenibacillus arenosi]MBD8500255.1 glycosyltransferase family 2 protein [Paenibacillus arenosi]